VVFVLLAALFWFVAFRLNMVRADRSEILIGGALLVAVFVASETLSLRIEVRAETFLISLSELPAVFGLIVLPAWVVGLAHVIAGLGVFIVRGDKFRSIRVNIALIAAESGLAAVITGIIPLGWDSPHVMPILGAAVGGVVAGVASSQAVQVNYWLLGSPEPALRVLVRSLLAEVTCSTFAVLAFTLIKSSPAPGGYLLCAALAIVAVVLYRTYSRFLRQHTDLTRMYTFGRQVTEIRAEPSDWHKLIEEVRDQLNAKVALVHLIEPTSHFQTLSAGSGGVAVEVSPDMSEPLLELAAQNGRAHVSSDLTTNPVLLEALAGRDAWDVLVVPLRSGDRVNGYLEVRDRLTRWGRFRENDVTLLEALSSHVATALENLRLLETLRHEAYHDEITGLLNWRGLAQATEASTPAGAVRGLMLLQLGILPEVNNAIGHDPGEQLLSAVGLRLVGALGRDSMVAHIESDRFAVLLSGGDQSGVLGRAVELLTVVGQPYSLDGIEVEPHAHAGLAHLDDGQFSGESVVAGGDTSTLLQRAEMALMAAQSSDTLLKTYGASMGQVFRRRFQLVTQFRRAVEDGLVTVHYQPKLSLQSRELVGVEALVRWTHPEFGPVSPAEFVEAIETTGSIDILLWHVLDIALAQVALWCSRDMRISAAVNLSVRNLAGANFIETVTAALDKHKVPPDLLTFEITESSVMADPERCLPILRDLHTMGIRLSVDDFGTGYSSLAYLRRLPIDEIKIDKSFVQGMVTDLSDHAIVRAIIDLGHSLGLRVVAEGVEEEAARDTLRDLDCDELQGFLLARPMPIEKLEAWFTTRTIKSSTVGSPSQILRLVG